MAGVWLLVVVVAHVVVLVEAWLALSLLLVLGAVRRMGARRGKR